jgi:hypothetical protein
MACLAPFEKHNETWTMPSPDERGSMPIGNGEVALDLWVEEDGYLLF